jgi:hypothetical protein
MRSGASEKWGTHVRPPQRQRRCCGGRASPRALRGASPRRKNTLKQEEALCPCSRPFAVGASADRRARGACARRIELNSQTRSKEISSKPAPARIGEGSPKVTIMEGLILKDFFAVNNSLIRVNMLSYARSGNFNTTLIAARRKE